MARPKLSVSDLVNASEQSFPKLGGALDLCELTSSSPAGWSKDGNG